MRAAHHADSALQAGAQMGALARELDKTHPRAAASLREGMAETLTVLRLGVPPSPPAAAARSKPTLLVEHWLTRHPPTIAVRSHSILKTRPSGARVAGTCQGSPDRACTCTPRR